MEAWIRCTALCVLFVSCTVARQYNDPNWFYAAEAKFTMYAQGEITVANGNVMVDLDITDIASFQGTEIPDDCFADGLYLHFHTEWNNNEEHDLMGTDNCDADQTGEHFDPWFACSRSSSSNDCAAAGNGCIRSSTFISDLPGVQYRCNTDGFSYTDYPYACEMGDMGKHDVMVDIDGERVSESWSSLWELNGLDFGQEYSVVIHCSNEAQTPVLCAPFNITNRTKTSSTPEHPTGDSMVSVSFDGLSVNDKSYDGITITQGEGWIRYQLPEHVGDDCTLWSAYIMDTWNHSVNADSAKYDEWCNRTFVGGVWDPTYSCINEGDGFMESGNRWCEDGTRCPGTSNTNVNYQCDNYENALKCAAGHLTGRTGYINLTKNGDYDMTFKDRVSPPLQHIAGTGKSILLVCESNPNTAMPSKMCAGISSSALMLAATDEAVGFTAGGAFAVIVLICLAGGIGAAYWYSKTHPKDVDSGDKGNNQNFTVLAGASAASLDSAQDFRANAKAPQTAHVPKTPPPVPQAATAQTDAVEVYSPPKQGDEDEAGLALPADAATDGPMGTMNEGGGYIENEEAEMEYPPADEENDQPNEQDDGGIF